MSIIDFPISFLQYLLQYPSYYFHDNRFGTITMWNIIFQRNVLDAKWPEWSEQQIAKEMRTVVLQVSMVN